MVGKQHDVLPLKPTVSEDLNTIWHMEEGTDIV